ncbi:uncharacterized protein LOC142354966 [Convolutriloba macropyga]|uniref:uncharacterized protein LOC142354966 n=1 Tax=Convolutriloba macropyga TaxID=536237 RepID=UPI003F527E2C
MAQHLRETLAEHLLMTQRELREARAEQKVMQLQLEVTQGQLLHTREELQEVQGQLSALQAAHPGKAHVPTSSSPVEDTSRRPTNPPQRVAVAFGESGADTVGILSLEDRVWELYCHQHTDSVLHVTSLGQQGQYLSCGKDRALKLWSSAGECLKTMRHSCAVNASALLKGENSGCAATACDDSTVRVWRLETGSCLAVLRGHQDKVEHLCALENGGLVSACSDGVLWVRAPDFHHVVSLVGHTDAVHAVAEVEGDTRVVSASSDFTLRVWQTVDGSCEHVLCGHNALVGAVCTVRVGRSSRKIVSGSYDGTLIVWDLDSGEQEAWLDGHWGQVTWVASLGPGARVISTSYDGTLRVWSLDTCTCEAVISCEENRLPWCVTELLLG